MHTRFIDCECQRTNLFVIEINECARRPSSLFVACGFVMSRYLSFPSRFYLPRLFLPPCFRFLSPDLESTSTRTWWQRCSSFHKILHSLSSSLPVVFCLGLSRKSLCSLFGSLVFSLPINPCFVRRYSSPHVPNWIIVNVVIIVPRVFVIGLRVVNLRTTQLGDVIPTERTNSEIPQN